VELIERELVEAEARLWDLNLLGRRAQMCDPDQAAAIVEEIDERLAIQAADRPARGGAVGGLVSVPTSQTERAKARTTARSERLRALLKAQAPERHKQRIAGLRRSVGFAARAQEADQRPGFRPDYVAMVTLTYADLDAWNPKHISKFLDTLRKWATRRGFRLRYVWVGELQKRGALHYHVALWLPPGVTIPKPDQAGWWTHGYTRTEAARKAVPYLLKYFSKGTDTRTFPPGARMHGSGGQDHQAKRAARWLRLPGFVQARAAITDDWKRATGGGWWSPDGLWVPSEYERAWVGDRWSLLRVTDNGRPFPADGPYNRWSA
jgi:hypothetical protein